VANKNNNESSSKETSNLFKRNDTFVDILGSEWTIQFRDEDPAFEKAQGYAEPNEKIIIIENVKPTNPNEPLELTEYAQSIDQKRVLRHEILHAFLMESGLDANANSVENWATNEEMVDWFAIQSPKIFKVYKELKLI
jgi:hypothetical protein